MNDIRRGSLVIDRDGHKGVVVKIEKGHDVVNHGAIVVWQIDRYEYGADNCEHYCEFNWRDSLKVLEY